MTIEQRIIAELGRLNNADPTLHSKALMLHTAVEKIIHQLKAHLGEISTQMKEYDKHDASHSEKVLENIEKLLRDGGIGRLSLLEAMTLRLCCYFHDSGMILPECYLPLLEDIEWDSRAELPDDLQPWLKENRKTYDVVQDQFYCPDSEEGYEEFLTDEMDRYQKYRLGLPEDISGEAHFRRTRHDYLRHTHGERAKRYAENLTHFLEGIPYGGRSDLAEAVGLICASHCQEITEVRKLETCLEIIDSCPDMACNVRYLAMLLRLGDVIHFSSDRASRTVYAERAAMDADSEIHWKTKFEELEYAIRPKEKGVSISYSGCFEDPKAYYFLQSHLDRVDEELRNYAAFVSDMHDEPDADRYSLGLPTNVFRDAIRASRFTPDPELKFRLEHRKIITLLMGMRLYRDEFMCLRELYQNALDACRCMRAENQQKGLSGELKIEFGLSSDRDGDYLYCKDEGTGMTMDIVKNYLLRIGNSYYQSDEFRRSNAQWGDAVAPVSEFGIGLLSCYMIASRIEVITRHHTLPGTPPIWVCMEDSDDYGYFRTPGRTQEKQVGLHGTYVKLYLKEAFKNKVTDHLPECPDDAVHELSMVRHALEDKKETEINEALSTTTGFSLDRLTELAQFSISLYSRIQEYIKIPENGIPIYICTASGHRQKLIDSAKMYDLADKLNSLTSKGLSIQQALNPTHSVSVKVLFLDMYQIRHTLESHVHKWLSQLRSYQFGIELHSEKAEARTILHLPSTKDLDIPLGLGALMDQRIDPFFAPNLESIVLVDGIRVYLPYNFKEERKAVNASGILFSYYGHIRPSLTVDRGEVKSIPNEMYTLKASLEQALIKEVSLKIREHFDQYPEAKTNYSLRYVQHYLSAKFGFTNYLNLVFMLSGDVFRNHKTYGITTADLFHSDKLCIPDATKYSNLGGSEPNLMLYLLGEADQIVVDGSEVLITRKRTVPGTWLVLGQEYDQDGLAVAVDNWQGTYAQYDIASMLWPLIPRRMAEVCTDLQPVSTTRKYVGKKQYTGPTVTRFAELNPVTLKCYSYGIETSDALLALSEEKETRTMHKCYCPKYTMDQKKYVIYVYIAPRKLSDEEKAFVAQYNHIPQYHEGVEKGWSILFYNYNDGYVIAPGIVDRMEMLKLLPDEALNHDDGLEYYFTDGTRAF